MKKMIELYFLLYTLKKSINAFFFQHSTFEGAPGGAPAAPHSALGKVGSKGGLESQEVGNNHSIDSYVYIYIYLHLYNIVYIYIHMGYEPLISWESHPRIVFCQIEFAGAVIFSFN